MSKILFYDLETTGIDLKDNFIWQIGGIIEIDEEIKEEFNIKICPPIDLEFDIEFLEKMNITKEFIYSGLTYEQGFIKLISILRKYVNNRNKKDKFHLVGYNNLKFDDDFLRKFFLDNNDKFYGSWFWSNTLDCRSLASLLLMNFREDIPNFKLGTIASVLGVDVDESQLHDALYDVKMTREIFNILKPK